MEPLLNLNFPTLPLFKTGKVRSVYDFGDNLLIVSSDRVSAFDCIMPNGIPNKGAVLTAVSLFWFEQTRHIVGNHIITADETQFPDLAKPYLDQLRGRSILVKKTDLIEFECVVRGYLAGSGWKDYQKTGAVCGHILPANLKLADPLPTPIFTPATKAASGHDENVSTAYMVSVIGKDLTNKLEAISLALYNHAHDYAQKRGIILADTKFEFGIVNGEILLIDEIFTPDSSRYWDAATYEPGISPPSYDKQIVRDYLESITWDKQPPAPALPDTIVQKTAAKYREIQEKLLA
ncbi:MAG: phosphoribosylaminoimidazolesuccinocarboxamide synthase [Candidatus Margulisiibacteriota bacterium]